MPQNTENIEGKNYFIIIRKYVPQVQPEGSSILLQISF